LRCETAPTQSGGLVDNSDGWEAYAKYLFWQMADGPAGKNKAYVSLSRGWAIGSGEFKAALVKDHDLAAISRAWESTGAQEIRETHWVMALARALGVLSKSDAACRTDPKSAPWKVAVAAHLKQSTQASNKWLNEQLRMGSPVAVSQYVSVLRRTDGEARRIFKRLTERLKT
jgi:hypothetical protein